MVKIHLVRIFVFVYSSAWWFFGGDDAEGIAAECGDRPIQGQYTADSKSAGYVVGGSNAVRGSLPWQVSGGSRNREYIQMSCRVKI